MSGGRDDGAGATQVVLLCGGRGQRLQREPHGQDKKELTEIGGRPLLWHLLKIFCAAGFRRYVVALGFAADQVRRFFLDLDRLTADLEIGLGGGGERSVRLLDADPLPPLQALLVDTGLDTDKGGRLMRLRPHLDADRFLVAYGDDLADVDLGALLRFHRDHGRPATVTGVRARFPFGTLVPDDDGRVREFREKPELPFWINGGFMVLERSVLERFEARDDLGLETEILPTLLEEGELMMYRHAGFWRSLNTWKDFDELSRLWERGAPWKTW